MTIELTTHTTQNQGGTLHKKLWSHVQTGVGKPHRIQRQRGDTAQRGGDTAHNTTYYLESGWGDTAQENVFKCLHWGGDTAQNSKKEGGDTAQIKVGCWLAGWLAGWFNDYSANPGSILQAETCKILS